MNEVERLGRENSRLSVELADRLKEREALLAISSTVNSTLELQEALRRICRELARLIGAETVSVHLHDRGSDLLFP
jgi:transcriptional regulator with GAF, ATPase, and Fis domain